MHCYCIRNPTRIRTLFYTYIILHSWTGRRLNLIPGFTALLPAPRRVTSSSSRIVGRICRSAAAGSPSRASRSRMGSTSPEHVF